MVWAAFTIVVAGDIFLLAVERHLLPDDRIDNSRRSIEDYKHLAMIDIARGYKTYMMGDIRLHLHVL